MSQSTVLPSTVTCHSSIATTVQTLSLQNFRNYSHVSLEAGSASVVLIGPNGAGKTNILEALSLLTPGRGLRHAKLSELCRRDAQNNLAWVVTAEIATGGETVTLGTAYAEGPETNRRKIRIQGEDARSQHALGRHVTALWLTPDMGHLFIEGASARRRFLDRLVYGFDPEHAARTHAYEHHMRERNRLLAMPGADAAWFNVVERKMAEYSVAIGVARLQATQHLNAACREDEGAAFPVARLEVEGEAEMLLQEGWQAVAVEDYLAAQIAAMRDADRKTTRSSIGAHKAQVLVWLEEKGIEAGFCSTGEQKALLLSILLAQARAQRAWRGMAPVLLLDEVVAHLDTVRRRALFEALDILGVQAFLTGTDAADFSGVKETAQFLQVNNGNLLFSLT